MPFYRFEVRSPSHVMVTDGADLLDSTAARIEASKRIGKLLTTLAGELWIDEDWKMDVTDEYGRVLYVIEICAMQCPIIISLH